MAAASGEEVSPPGPVFESGEPVQNDSGATASSNWASSQGAVSCAGALGLSIYKKSAKQWQWVLKPTYGL